LNCTRFFFFHYAAGTSAAYTDLEKSFIAGVQEHFPGGIKNWDFVQSWADGTATRYPEGFWWVNFKEKVLALTYEDTNCPNAGRFDSTGMALVIGSVDYIRARAAAPVLARARGETGVLLLAEGVRIAPGASGTRWDVFDTRGRRLASGTAGPQGALLTWKELPGAPARFLSVIRPGGSGEKVRLPAFPE
jgi:hypothetical protein